MTAPSLPLTRLWARILFRAKQGDAAADLTLRPADCRTLVESFGPHAAAPAPGPAWSPDLSRGAGCPEEPDR